MSLIELALQRAKATAKPTDTVPVDEVPRTPTVAPAPPSGNVADETPRTVLSITEAFLRERGLSAPADQEHQQRAEYRHIKYGLLQDIRNSTSNGLVLVTSALEGEGKTFSSVHLAISLASEPDYDVLLVDADVIRPSLSRMFGLGDQPGLMDAVVNANTRLESLVVPTSVPGLSILPVGRPDDRATELFASTRMHEVISEILSVPNRIVVVDTLPLLLTTEARVLTSVGGQVVLVVRAESTPRSAVMSAIEMLGEGTNVKLLLNARPRTKALGYFGYGYGYDYTSNREEQPDST